MLRREQKELIGVLFLCGRKVFSAKCEKRLTLYNNFIIIVAFQRQQVTKVVSEISLAEE